MSHDDILEQIRDAAGQFDRAWRLQILASKQEGVDLRFRLRIEDEVKRAANGIANLLPDTLAIKNYLSRASDLLSKT